MQEKPKMRRKLEKEKERKKDYGIIYKIKRPFNKVADEKQISKSLSEISERAFPKNIDIEIGLSFFLHFPTFRIRRN